MYIFSGSISLQFPDLKIASEINLSPTHQKKSYMTLVYYNMNIYTWQKCGYITEERITDFKIFWK